MPHLVDMIWCFNHRTQLRERVLISTHSNGHSIYKISSNLLVGFPLHSFNNIVFIQSSKTKQPNTTVYEAGLMRPHFVKENIIEMFNRSIR